MRDRRAGDGRARPHMIEPPTAIGGEPILRAIAPPGIEPRGRRHEMPPEIDPVMRRPQSAERLHLDGRMADHIEQLLVIPDVRFKRRDIEVADDHRRLAQSCGPLGHPFDEGEFLREFEIERRIGNIAAGGNIDVLQPDAIRQTSADVARLAIVLPIMATMVRERNTAEDGDPVVHPLAVEQAMHIAEPLEHRMRERAVLNLGFLQAQNVRAFGRQKLLDDRYPGSNRVDVPGRDLGCFGHRPAM